MLHLAILHDWFPSPPPQPGQYLFKNMGQSPQFKPQRENNWFGRLNPFMASPIISCLVFRCCQCNNRAFPETLNQELFCFLTKIIRYTLPELWFFIYQTGIVISDSVFFDSQQFHNWTDVFHAWILLIVVISILTRPVSCKQSSCRFILSDSG